MIDIQEEYINTSEFFEPEDNAKIDSEFTDVTPMVRLYENNNERSPFTVYKARRYGQWWALKCISKDVVDKSRILEILRKEFSVGISLWHPNIVRMISLQHNLVEDASGIVLEFVDGVSLDEFMDNNPPLETRVKIAEQIISAMQYYMGKQVVHCDLKPSNILVTMNGYNVKIIDFGFADLDSYNVFKGHAGTDIYAAPEQKISDGVVDCRSDFYAFGHILKLLKLPRRYNHIIRKCLKESPEDRYQNPMELHLDFDGANEQQLSKWTILTGVMGILITIGAFVLGNWASQHTVKNLSTSRDEIMDGKMPAMYFGDSVKIHSNSDETYVVPNATTLHYISNSKQIPGNFSSDIAVDLGLSVNWAPFNVGSSSASSNDVGGYYNWGDNTGTNVEGEIEFYSVPKQANSISGTSLDLAHVKWGNGWRMPTQEEFQELIDKCRWTLINKRGSVQGYLVTGPSGKCIFLPFGGIRRGTAHYRQGIIGSYWSASPYSFPQQAAAYLLEIDNETVSIDQCDLASTGYSIRPVHDK